MKHENSRTGYDLSLATGHQQAIMNPVSNGDTGAKARMTHRNQHLIVNMARQHTNRGVALFELVKECNWGNIHAPETHEVKNGISFLTPATECIQQNHHAESSQSKLAYVLTFDNPAHERRVK